MRVTTAVKIRFLLAVLTVGFFVTALTIRLTFDHQEVLVHDGREIERNLHQKEQVIRDFLQDDQQLARLRAAATGIGEEAEYLITHFTEKNNIFLYLFEGNELVYWSSEQYVPSRIGVPELYANMIQVGNGWYRSMMHQEGSLTALFLIPVKAAFQKVNEYLQNDFSADLISTDNLEIAGYDDRQVFNVRDQQGQYLFSVKLNVTRYESFYSDLELLMWILGAIFAIILIQISCLAMARIGFGWISIFLFGGFLVGVRWVELKFGWFDSNFNVGIFNPLYYASSQFFPHLGGFIFNIILFTWWSAYIFAIRDRLWMPRLFYSPKGGVALLALYGCWMYVLCKLISGTFENLINHSDINLDVTDMLNLDFYSWIGVYGLCLAVTVIALNIGWMMHIVERVLPRRRMRMRILYGMLLAAPLLLMLTGHFTLYYIPVAGLILLRSWYHSASHRYGVALIISGFLVLAAIASLKHTDFHRKKRQEAQKRAILKLESVDDASALALFFDLEREIPSDSIIIDYFKHAATRLPESLDEHLKKVYFSGYLSRYEFATGTYDSHFRAFGPDAVLNLSAYRDKVISGAIKVSENFYRQHSNFGNFEYFAQFPINLGDQFLGILLIDMSSRSFSPHSSYPGVLADSRLDQRQTELLANYSSAIYKDGKLVNQSGRYVYPVIDSMYYPMGNREFKSVGRDGGFSHLAYKPDARTLIVLGKPEQGVWMQFASVSFFFLVFLLFFLCMFFLIWLVRTLSVNDFSLRNLRWSYLILTNRTLYSTRIQAFIVFAVVFTLITAGVITYFSVSSQFNEQQERTIVQHAWEIAKNMESRILKSAETLDRDQAGVPFVDLAESNALDMNLYDTSGRLIYTTQPRIYDLELISSRLNARAFVHLRHYGRSRYVEEERIGRMNYLSAYATLHNSDHEPIAFLSLPYYSSQQEFDKNIGVLLNTLINIYALVILVLGLFAVFVANRITAPLLLVQRSLSKTKIGTPNEPIFWKRNDEIGSLIKEYNLMIAELEHSASKLMQSERESAWKEMAKQVAHEIKNPLTPLKLGIQQLERSWKDEDPGFEDRFKRFIVSFVEQIDSLTRIATEFSDFAKMPDANYVEIDLMEVIRNSAAVFDPTSNVSIRITAEPDAEMLRIRGDKDQLLRTFNNLIKNSIEAAATKRRCLIQIHVSTDGEVAIIDIKDNGEGISPEARKKMFQPNFTTKSSGTGLGLAFVRRAVESVGGHITFQSQVGKGTTFTIRIPLWEG